MNEENKKVDLIDFGEEFGTLESYEVGDMFDSDEIAVYASTVNKF